MLRPRYPYYLANAAAEGTTTLPVVDKYSGAKATEVSLASAAVLDVAIGWAVKAAPAMAALGGFEKAEVLEHCVKRFTERQEELAVALCIEAGKPIKDSRGEVTRLIDTFKIAMGEATRQGGEVLPLDISARAKNYWSLVRRVPVGPVAVLDAFDDFEAALAQVNDSVFGLQAGIFTRDLHKARRAWDVLQVGGVVIGDVPSFRVDNMPYGGVKDSGIGREGVRWAIDHLTEPRVMVVRTPSTT